MGARIFSRGGICFVTGEVFDDDVIPMKDLENSPLQEVVIDLSQCKRMCSLGLGVLVLLQKRLNKKGKALHLINPSEFFKTVLSTTGLEKFFIVKHPGLENLVKSNSSNFQGFHS